MRTRLICLAWTTTLLLAPEVAYASCAYIFDQTNYRTTPGGKVDVYVYLQETDTTVLRDEGLIGAGVKLRFDDSPQPSSPAKVLANTEVANISGFEVVWNTVRAHPALGYADLSLGTLGDGILGVATPPGSGTFQVALGRFTFTAGMVPNEVSHIRATDFNAGSDDTVYYRDNNPLDPVSLDSMIHEATATITTTPEPSVLAILASGMIGVLAYVCWKWR